MPKPRDPSNDKPAGWQWPDNLTDDDGADLRLDIEAAFGKQASETLFGTFQDALPAGVVEALQDMSSDPGMPSVDDLRDTHERVRRLVGDMRPKRSHSGVVD
jgi:hypothetical protein